jgi:uncharacterized protein with HEPN domain
MTERSLRLPDFLDHILTAIQRIETYTAGMQKETFLVNLLVQDAVIRNFEIIGEASKSIERISPEFVAENAEIPFLFAYDMRNVLAHAYHKVDLNICLGLSLSMLTSQPPPSRCASHSRTCNSTTSMLSTRESIASHLTRRLLPSPCRN